LAFSIAIQLKALPRLSRRLQYDILSRRSAHACTLVPSPMRVKPPLFAIDWLRPQAWTCSQDIEPHWNVLSPDRLAPAT
jgi:hypothetical protein